MSLEGCVYNRQRIAKYKKRKLYTIIGDKAGARPDNESIKHDPAEGARSPEHQHPLASISDKRSEALKGFIMHRINYLYRDKPGVRLQDKNIVEW